MTYNMKYCKSCETSHGLRSFKNKSDICMRCELEGTEEKFCPRCQETKSKTDFTKNRNAVDGLQGYCRKCAQIYATKNFQRNAEKLLKRLTPNRELIKNILQNSECIDCGLDNWVVLEFDHVKDKSFTIAQALISPNKFTKEQILEEIEKCEIVCANCHRLRTYTRNNSWRLR